MTLQMVLAAAVDDLESQHVLAGSIIGATDENWRNKLVQSRRELSRSIGEIAELISKVDTTSLASPADRDRAREGLSRFRHVVAMHQASYPASAIGADTGAYRKSAQGVRSGQAELIGLIRRIYRLPSAIRPSS